MPTTSVPTIIASDDPIVSAGLDPEAVHRLVMWGECGDHFMDPARYHVRRIVTDEGESRTVLLCNHCLADVLDAEEVL